MTATNHALTGALIATLTSKPLLAIPLAFVAHFVLDAIPHFGVSKSVFIRNKDSKFWRVLKIDVVLVAILLILIPFLSRNQVPIWLTFACMFACMSPDLIWGWRFLLELKEKKVRPKSWFSKFHSWIQWSETIKIGGAVELLWFVSVLSLLVTQS